MPTVTEEELATPPCTLVVSQVSEPSASDSAEDIQTLSANFLLLGLYQIVLRIGWIFKTESIIMPAVLDLMGGGAWLRACLPMLNRIGQSVPPLIAAPRIRSTRFKKHVLGTTTLLMGAVFLALSMVWSTIGAVVPWWIPLLFLFAYSVFFVSVGVNQLVLGTLQGKLIGVQRRGRFMLFSNSVGATLAVIAVVALLPMWLGNGESNFTAIFGFTGAMFVISAGLTWLLKEQADKPFPKERPIDIAKSLRQTMRTDKNFRLLAFTAALFGMSMTLFPHYQAFGRERLDLGLENLMIWIVAQNAGLAVVSFPIGWVADRFGNRLALQLLIGSIVVTPILALVLASAGTVGAQFYFVVFVFVGLVPITIRTFNNYTLELVSRDRQPQYLSLLSLFMAGPAIFTSVIVGLLLEVFDYEIVFVSVSTIVLVGLLLSLRIKEPRKSRSSLASN
jgi:hypothetical protein